MVLSIEKPPETWVSATPPGLARWDKGMIITHSITGLLSKDASASEALLMTMKIPYVCTKLYPMFFSHVENIILKAQLPQPLVGTQEAVNTRRSILNHLWRCLSVIIMKAKPIPNGATDAGSVFARRVPPSMPVFCSTGSACVELNLEMRWNLP